MTAKHFFTCSIFYLGSNVLFAQSSLVMPTKNLDGLEEMNVVQFLAQNALVALIGVVIFIGQLVLCGNERMQRAKKVSKTIQQLLFATVDFDCGIEHFLPKLLRRTTRKGHAISDRSRRSISQLPFAAAA